MLKVEGGMELKQVTLSAFHNSSHHCCSDDWFCARNTALLLLEPIPIWFPNSLLFSSVRMVLSRPLVDYCIWAWDNLPRTLLMYYTNFLSSPEGYFGRTTMLSSLKSETLLVLILEQGHADSPDSWLSYSYRLCILGRNVSRASGASFYLGSQEQQAQPRLQEISPPSSWYPPPGSPSSSRPTTAGSSSSTGPNIQRASDHLHSSSHGQISPSESAGIIYLLKDKSVDELRKLLSDKEAYNQFLLSLDQVKIQNNLRDELRKETSQLARENSEKEPRILELRNQCRIIRTTELAAAHEKLNELQRQKEETLKFYSPSSLLQKLQESMNIVEEESETLHNQLLAQEIDVNTFVQKHKKLRTTYHRLALTLLAAKTSYG